MSSICLSFSKVFSVVNPHCQHAIVEAKHLNVILRSLRRCDEKFETVGAGAASCLWLVGSGLRRGEGGACKALVVDDLSLLAVVTLTSPASGIFAQRRPAT